MTKGQPVQQAELPMKDAKQKTVKAAVVADAKKNEKKATKKAAEKPGNAVAVVAPKAAVPAAPASMLEVIGRAVADPRVDPAKMQALLDVQERIEDRDAKKAYTRAFVQMQGRLPVINRDGKIEIRDKVAGQRTGPLVQATPYATYPALMKVCKPIMNDFGFSFSSRVAPGEGGKILVISTLRHIEGYSEQSEFPMISAQSGSQNIAQGWGATQSYCMRYNAIALLNITTQAVEDRDTDAHEGAFQNAKGGGLAQTAEKPKTITEEQAIELRDVMEANRVTGPMLFGHYGITRLMELRADLFDAALKLCVENGKKARG